MKTETSSKGLLTYTFMSPNELGDDRRRIAMQISEVRNLCKGDLAGKHVHITMQDFPGLKNLAANKVQGTITEVKHVEGDKELLILKNVVLCNSRIGSKKPMFDFDLRHVSKIEFNKSWYLPGEKPSREHDRSCGC